MRNVHWKLGEDGAVMLVKGGAARARGRAVKPSLALVNKNIFELYN